MSSWRVPARHEEGLQAAHRFLLRDLTGRPRAEELVRQAEVLAQGGYSADDVVAHGEMGLSSVPPDDANDLLARLAALAPTAAAAVDLYERHVSRTKVPAERQTALARAAQEAAARHLPDRARGFFELALAGNVLADETVERLENAAREGDGATETTLRRVLADAFAASGHGFRDGGRTRSMLLRRAANIAHRELDEPALAFQWLADAVTSHVDAVSLDALTALGEETNDFPSVEAMLSRALGEVFDGPLVRQLLARRASVRRLHTGDLKGAAQDLKKLHELTPGDQDVLKELIALLEELCDYRTMVQVLEDQILRGKDPATRGELAWSVAVLWEEKLGEAREAADAWRRVLRLRPGDPEAQAGLDRAKSNALRRDPALTEGSGEAPASADAVEVTPAAAVSSLPGLSPPVSSPEPPSSGRNKKPRHLPRSSSRPPPPPPPSESAPVSSARPPLHAPPRQQGDPEELTPTRPVRPSLSMLHYDDDEPTLSRQKETAPSSRPPPLEQEMTRETTPAGAVPTEPAATDEEDDSSEEEVTVDVVDVDVEIVSPSTKPPPPEENIATVEAFFRAPTHLYAPEETTTSGAESASFLHDVPTRVDDTNLALLPLTTPGAGDDEEPAAAGEIDNPAPSSRRPETDRPASSKKKGRQSKKRATPQEES